MYKCFLLFVVKAIKTKEDLKQEQTNKQKKQIKTKKNLPAIQFNQSIIFS